MFETARSLRNAHRPDCVISIEIGVNGDAYPAAVSQKVTKNLPASFYSPMPGFKASIRFVNKLIYKLMGDNGFGDNGPVHVMCLTICMISNYYSKQVLHITEFNGLFQLVPLVFFKFYARIQYEHLAHYLF